VSAAVSKGCGGCRDAKRSQPRVLVVQSPSDLTRLKTWRRHYDVVKVRLSGLPDAERLRIEETIKDYFVCGCVPARWAAVAVIACAILASLVAHEAVLGASWNVFVVAGVAALLVPLATMLLSILRARRRLWRTLDGLQRAAEARR